MAFPPGYVANPFLILLITNNHRGGFFWSSRLWQHHSYQSQYRRAATWNQACHQDWGIVQDLSQLERIYGEGWQSFIANAGMINYFGSSDQKTAQYFSSMCGEKTVWSLSSAISHTIGTSSGSGSGTSSNSSGQSNTRSAAQRKLAYPDELMRLKANEQIAFIENM